MSDPIEQFVLDYIDAAGGIVDAVEPQVYDVMLAEADTPLRLTFDPEALPEHPSAQLITFGSALLDQFVRDAQARGRVALAYLDDVHLTSQTLETRLRRDLILPSDLTFSVQTMRPLYVTTTLFWFQVTYTSDEKEQALYPVAVDRYYRRLARHLEPRLDRLSELRRYPFPDAEVLPLDRAYLLARERLVRTVSAEANNRQHTLSASHTQQHERMTRYFADLRAELNERLEKVQARGEETDTLQARLEALQREEALRLDEWRHTGTLRVQLLLTNLLHIKSPRLFVESRLTSKSRAPMALRLTWDPIVEKTDAFDCPNCKHPTFELRVGRRGELRCPACAG